MALQYPASGANHLDDPALVGGPAIDGNLSMSYWLNVVSFAAVQSINGLYTTVTGVAGVQLGIRTNAFCAWAWGGIILAQGTSSPTGVWVHVCYTYNGTTHRIYVNGVEEGNSTVAPQAGNALVIQYNSYAGGGASEIYDGLIADTRIYSRTLAPAEVQTLHACAGVDGIIDGLFCHHLFQDEAPGTAVTSGDIIDVSGTQQGSLSLIGTGFTYAEGPFRSRRRVA